MTRLPDGERNPPRTRNDFQSSLSFCDLPCIPPRLAVSMASIGYRRPLALFFFRMHTLLIINTGHLYFSSKMN